MHTRHMAAEYQGHKFKKYECAFKYQRRGTVTGYSVVISFLLDGLAEPSAFPSVVQWSAAAVTSFSIKFACRFITCDLSSIKSFHPAFLYNMKLFLMLDATQCFMRMIILTAFPESLLFHFSHSMRLFYCCWQTRIHTYPSCPLWWSLSLPTLKLR